MHNKEKAFQSLCRFCKQELHHTFIDLGMSPLCESYIAAEDLNRMEPFYPLHAYVCASCFLVQLEEYVKPEEIFTEYAYFSSYSDSWVEHARQYSKKVIERFSLDTESLVIEIASNDGYLLQHFVQRKIPVLGIEPAANVVEAAVQKNIPTLVLFFGDALAHELASQGKKADLLVGNNVLAQVPDLNDFVQGMVTLLNPNGVLTMEFPHLVNLIEENQFDTIYHEHFSYFSFLTVKKVFAAHGLRIFDVEKIPTHGGSLRIYACHKDSSAFKTEKNVLDLEPEEASAGLSSLDYYLSFQEKVRKTKRNILDFLIQAKRDKKTIAGYGAPGKGNTLLNYCGIRTDFIDYVVDRNPYKQGKFLPGSRIPIFKPEKLKATKPNYVIIMPWNFKEEIIEQVSYLREWGGKFVVFIPSVKVYE